jgi:hypothetical protein
VQVVVRRLTGLVALHRAVEAAPEELRAVVARRRVLVGVGAVVLDRDEAQ